ncbi:hypothetical protein E3P86_03234 [Wallemia ichthyophaga]|uniref:Branchpoint-bridging protein n=2 Tax=Wallemia ichthyophaga TaxID=245174 RepID=A0A4T0IQ05_WALIC|nr:hypothetical protein E3P86_03234 [Wallemia ichthyophaga]
MPHSHPTDTPASLKILQLFLRAVAAPLHHQRPCPQASREWRVHRPTANTPLTANNIPLGNRRKYGNGVEEEAPRGRPTERPEKRMREMPPPPPPSDQPRKRKSRWGDAADSGAVLPTAIYNANAAPKAIECYAAQMRIEEINQKILKGRFVPSEAERSPSPPPSYDSWGKRTNTREQRYKLKLERERIKLIDKVMKMDPSYRPPSDYNQARRSTRPTEKVYIPTHDFPEVNFFGLLVGPRGNSLKNMERQSGAKISIRGKGSVKEGKGRPDSMDSSGEEDLHCVVSADSEEKVRRCVKLINKVIETAASTPEGENDHKRSQLRELASLNGTLRDDEGQICQSCGAAGHRRWECPEGESITTQIKCALCGQSGHLSRDCTVNPAQAEQIKGASNAPGFDSEYANLMAELGEGGGTSKGMIEGGSGQQSAQPTHSSYVEKWQSEGKNLPPWRNPDVSEECNCIKHSELTNQIFRYGLVQMLKQGVDMEEVYLTIRVDIKDTHTTSLLMAATSNMAILIEQRDDRSDADMLIPCVNTHEVDDNSTHRKRLNKLVIGGPVKNSFAHLSHTSKDKDKENVQQVRESPIMQNSISIKDAQLRAAQVQMQMQNDSGEKENENGDGNADTTQSQPLNLTVSDDGLGALPRSASSVGRLASVKRKPVPRLSSKGEIVPSSSNIHLNDPFSNADFAPTPAITITASAQ